MKKVLLFLSVLLWGAATAEAQQFAMPQGTTNNIYPFGSTTSNKVQWLYKPSDFTTPPTPGNITKLYFKTWNGAATYTATYGNFSIRMINTALNAFPNTTFITPSTLVFTGNPVVVPVTNQLTWFSFTLQTPFTYTGQNIILEIEQNSLAGSVTLNCTNAGGNQRIFGTYGSVTGANIDNSIGDLGFDMCASCDSPINIVKNNLGLHNVDLTWDPISCASGYEYQIDQTPSNPPSVGYATVPNAALSLSNLPDGTCYYIHLKTQCGGPFDTSGWSLDSFCTIANCQVPEVTIEDVKGTSAIARWAAVPGALGYEYSTGTTPNPPTKGAYTTYTNVKLQGLIPNAPLYFYIRAQCTPTPLSEWGVTPFHTTVGTGVDDPAQHKISVDVYPNPAKDMITVHINGTKSGTATIQLTDITGKIINTKTLIANRTDINVASLAPGLYYLKYADEAYQQIIKVNKQ